MGDEGDPDVNAQLAALATGLAGLQTAVTQLVSAVNDNICAATTSCRACGAAVRGACHRDRRLVSPRSASYVLEGELATHYGGTVATSLGHETAAGPGSGQRCEE